VTIKLKGKVKIKPPEELPIKPPKPPSSLSDDDLIGQLTEALKRVRPLRGVQEKIYTKARAQKLARMMRAREKMAGERGFYEELGALKGELPKVEFESIRQQFNQEAVDRLFNMIKKSNRLDEWEKINAQIGLSKLLGEKGAALPTKKEIEHLYQVFGKDFTDALLSKRPLIEKLTEAGMQLYNLPRSMMAGIGDFSATLMQNVMFAFRHPVLTAKNFKEQLRFFANERAYKMAMEEIANRPTYDAMKKAKLSLTEVGPFMSKREEQFMSSWAEKIPGLGKLIRATGRAYTGFLNKMRADVFDQLYNSAADMGINVADERFLRNLGDFINAATGRGSLGKLERAAPVLTQGLFSARKLAATLNLINPAFYIRAHPVVRKEALKTWLSFLGGGMTILGLAKLAGADVETDPTSADFGKIKIGNTRLNIFGQYQQIAVLLGRLLKGYATSSVTGKRMMFGEGYRPLTRTELIGRFFEMKQHPTLSYLKGLVSGQTSLGQPFQWAPELLNRFTPMLLSDAYDLYQEHGPRGLLALIPAALGVSVQTYGRSMPVVETTRTGEKTIKLKFAPGLSETIISKITGQPLTTIPREQWDEIARQQRVKSSQKYLREQANRLNKMVDEGKMTLEEAEAEMAKMYNSLVFKPETPIKGTALSPIAISLGIDKYLGKPPSGTIEKAKWEVNRFKAAVKVLGAENIDDATKEKLIKQLGQDPTDVMYYDIARSDRSVRRAAVDEVIASAGGDRNALLASLETFRREVRGKRILTDTVIKDLVEEGILTPEEGKYLKSIKFVKDKKTGKWIKQAKTKGGKKVRITGTPKFKAPKPKAIKAPQIKITVPRTSPLKGIDLGMPAVAPLTTKRNFVKIKSTGLEDLRRMLERGIQQPTVRVKFGR